MNGRQKRQVGEVETPCCCYIKDLISLMREYKNNFKSSTDADRGSHSTIFLDCFSESHSIYHTFKYNFANAYCVPGQHPPKCLLVNYTLFCALTLLHSITIKAITYIKLPE